MSRTSEESNPYASIDVGVQPPAFYPLTSLTPNQEWRRHAEGTSSYDDRLSSCRRELLDKIVWVRVDSDGNEVAARVKSVLWRDAAPGGGEKRMVLGVDVLPNDAGLDVHPSRRDSTGAAFVDPGDVALLSMKELLDLPPPPPPLRVSNDAENQQPAFVGSHDDGVAHLKTKTDHNDENVDPERTPPQLRPVRTPSWAEALSCDLEDALRNQDETPPPADFDVCFAGAPRTCDLAKIFQRPSLTVDGYRETGDWSKDDW